MDRWDRRAEDSDGEYKREDFQLALYRLVTEQAIYHADMRGRMSYRLVDQYEHDFRETLELMAVDLRVNRELRYVVAIPRHAKLSHSSIDETLLALVLRKLQDEGLQRGEMTEEGEIHVELSTLSERYRLETGRPFPEKGRLDTVLRALRRYGIVKVMAGDDEAGVLLVDVGQPYTVAIRPATADILGEAAIERLAQWRLPGVGPLPHAESEREEMEAP